MSIGAHAHYVETCDIVEREVTFYAGTASCSAYSSELGGWTTLTEYFSPQPEGQGNISEYVSDGNYGYVRLSCMAMIPYGGTTTVEVEECVEVEHEHDPSPNPIAVADVQSNNMIINDSSCSWAGWQNYSTSRMNRLTCNGQLAATVVHILGAPYYGNGCTANTYNGYSRLNPGSSTCLVSIYDN